MRGLYYSFLLSHLTLLIIGPCPGDACVTSGCICCFLLLWFPRWGSWRSKYPVPVHVPLFFSMGQRTPRCPAAVSLVVFLGELYVNVNLGPAYPRLLGTVRRRFACVFPFFLFLLPVAIIYSFFVFPPRCGTVYVTSRVGFSCCCVFRQLMFRQLIGSPCSSVLPFRDGWRLV